MLQVGSLVDNKYKILSEVGHGGMSVVYLAINERANKTWAVKEVRKDGVCDFEAVKQGLVVETDMLKKLDHPHLPSIIDVIDTEDSFLIVMDYIEGKSLQSVLKNGGAQPQDLVVEWGKQLCDVLGYLHSRQPAIIYRDMKPANVMLKPDGNITLIDFGTAREFKNRSKVEDTTCLGTRGYAAPEQFGGRGETDARTDIYCLGATMYHLLTGHSPAEPPYEIKPLRYWDPNFAGTGMEFIINKCCQQDPDARYQSCAELMYDLENVHTLDQKTQKARKMKWNAFIASIALFLVGVAGTIGFSIAKNGATQQTYDYYLEQAEQLIGDENFEAFTQLVKQAVEVDPANYNAYDVLLSRIESDGKFNEALERPALNACLSATAEGNRETNDKVLKNGDADGYADIQYRIGNLYFLMADGTENQLRQAANYYTNALDAGQWGQSQDAGLLRKAKIAQTLATIGKEIGSLNSASSQFLERDYSYTTLWDSLKGIVADDPVVSMGNKSFGVATYGRVASMIQAYNQEFATEGVQAQDILDVLTQIETALDQINGEMTTSESARGLGQQVENAKSNVATARHQVESWKGDA